MELATLGAASDGVWTRREALAAVTPAQLRHLLASGTWQAPWPGVYADAGHVLGPQQRARAAVLAGGDAERVTAAGAPAVRVVACGRTAARLHGLLLIDDDDPATGADEHLADDVTGWTHTRPLRRAGGRSLHRRQLVLRAGDVVRSRSGLWLTSLDRTVVDCAALLGHGALVSLLDDVLHRGLLEPADLDRLVRDRAGLPGVLPLRRGVAVSDGRAESASETLARLLLQPCLPGLIPQVRLRDRHGRVVARFDLAEERLRLAVELDGRRAHAGEVMAAKDRRRDATALGLGWTTERGTWTDLRCRQAEFAARVVASAQRLS